MDDPYERLQLRVGGALALVGSRRQWMERYQADALASVAVTGGDSLKHANSFFGLFMSSMELGDQAWRGALAEFQAVIARYPHPILADLQPFLEMIAGVIDGRPSDVEASATELGRLWTSHGRGLEAQVYQNSGLLQAAREKMGLEPLLDLLVENPLYNPNKPGAITGIMALALAESGQLDRTKDHIEAFGANDFADIANDGHSRLRIPHGLKRPRWYGTIGLARSSTNACNRSPICTRAPGAGTSERRRATWGCSQMRWVLSRRRTGGSPWPNGNTR